MNFINTTPQIINPFRLATKAGECLVEMTKESPKLHNITISNRFGKELGHEFIQIDTNDQIIYGLDMAVNQEYRQRGYRFGEILRLVSVAEMVQNGFKAIEIFAARSAAGFHHKYMFKSNIADIRHAKMILEGIMADRNIPKARIFRERAQKALAEFNFDEMNKIVDDYLSIARRANLEGKCAPAASVPMVLNEETVLGNTKFFNKLYARHKINFEI